MAERKYLKDKKGIVYPITSKEAVIGLVDEINKLNDSIKALLGVDITYFLGREEAMSLLEQKKDNFEFTDSDNIKWDTSDTSKPKAIANDLVTTNTSQTINSRKTFKAWTYFNSGVSFDNYQVQFRSWSLFHIDNDMGLMLYYNYVNGGAFWTSNITFNPITRVVKGVNELDNGNEKPLVRYKETEAKNVFGGADYDALIMGKSDRPYYSKDESDFTGEELALKSDIDNCLKKPEDTTSYVRVPLIQENTNDQFFWTATAGSSGYTVMTRNSNGQSQVASLNAVDVDNTANNGFIVNNRLLREYVAAKAFTKPTDTTSIARIPIVDANTTDQSYLSVTPAATRAAVVQRNAQGYIQIAAPASTNVDDSNYHFYVPNYAILKDYVAAKTTPKWYLHVITWEDEDNGPFGGSIHMQVVSTKSDAYSLAEMISIYNNHTYDSISFDLSFNVDSHEESTTYTYQPLFFENLAISDNFITGTISGIKFDDRDDASLIRFNETCLYTYCTDTVYPLH